MSEIDHLSYSSVNTYLSCGKSWELKYIQKVPASISATMVFGSAWHSAIEAMIIERSQFAGANAIETWQRCWSKQLAEKPDIDWGGDTPESYFNDGIRMLNDIGIQMAIENIRVGGADNIERNVTLRVPGVPVPITGFIDLITEDGVPGDIKTSSRAWSEDKAAGELQPLYYLAALSQAGVPVEGGRFRHYVFCKTKQPKVQVLEHTHSMKEIFFLFNMLQNIWKAIEAGVFIESPNDWKCSPVGCGYWQHCRGKWL
jgi:hypothetical protein